MYSPPAPPFQHCIGWAREGVGIYAQNISTFRFKLQSTFVTDCRWRMFKLHKQIPRDEQRDINPCGHCFAELLLGE